MFNAPISDSAIAEAVAHELDRQRNPIELIASENIVSSDVLAAQGSVLTNKYAEGYPGRRYYGGCEHVDVVKTIAIHRLKQLFGAGYANVQPHFGAQANQAVFLALLQPGDRRWPTADIAVTTLVTGPEYRSSARSTAVTTAEKVKF